MWLAGWGHVFENYSRATRIVQLPGDLDAVAEPNAFFGNLRSFLAVGKDPDISVGDYDLPDPFGAKHLIDHYGTYPLLANWFPDLTRRILRESINRVRSEFLNLKVKTLKDLLKNRKFAYEQTLNMLIRSYDHDNDKWIHDVRRHPLGSLQDDASFRGYRECLDQIERTERMLKVLWRVLNKPADQKDYPRFVERYHVLDRISTSIREAAATTIRSLLGLRSY
jgi:hypothetical protein